MYVSRVSPARHVGMADGQPVKAGIASRMSSESRPFWTPITHRLSKSGVNGGVTSGEEAMELIKSEPFDVALLDVKMPGLGGLELVKRIQSFRPELQMVLLTGHGSVKDAEDGKALGVFDYLMKPIKLEELLDILRAAASQRRETGQ